MGTVTVEFDCLATELLSINVSFPALGLVLHLLGMLLAKLSRNVITQVHIDLRMKGASGT